jgi:bleomycin hydrolase
LIKDSGRSARWGRHEGYYFFRGDYVKLKMLTYTVHKDISKNILAKVK